MDGNSALSFSTSVDADSLLANAALPLRATYHPMGYPVQIATNDREVLEGVREAWSCYQRVESEPRVSLAIAVRGSGRPVTRNCTVSSREHLMSFIADPENFMVCDLRERYAFGWLTEEAARNRAHARYHLIEPAAYVLLEAAALTPVHASCVAWNGRALLLCGDSGAGKTTLAYACARRGWTYLADDATHIVRQPFTYTVTGRPYSIRFRESARTVFPELNAFRAVLRPNGKVDYEVSTNSLGIAVAERAEAAGVVFLKRSAGRTGACCRLFPVEEAQQRLARVINFGDRDLRAEQNATLTKLLRRNVLELEYENLDNAEAVLRRYVC